MANSTFFVDDDELQFTGVLGRAGKSRWHSVPQTYLDLSHRPPAWGPARSTMNTSLVMVLSECHRQVERGFWNFLLVRMELMGTMCGFAFGTSIPMVPLPGIGAMIRYPVPKDSGRCRPPGYGFFEIRTPSAGVISYKVMVGPHWP